MTHVIQMVKHLESSPELSTVPGIRVRTFRWPSSDARQWLWLRQNSGLWEEPNAGRGWTERDFRREFVSKWWWRPEHTWLAEETAANGLDSEAANIPDQLAPALVGSITLGMRGTAETPRPMVHWLLVARLWRRRGVGRKLLETLEQECRNQGYLSLSLETLSSWTEAVEFYQDMGFVRAESLQ